MIKTGVLSDRLCANPAPAVPLSELQQQHLELFRKKITSGEYQEVQRPCPVCESSSTRLFAERDRLGILMQSVICAVCGMLRTDPYLRDEDLSDFYSQHYRALYSASELSTDEHFSFQVAQRGKPALEYLSSLGILDRDRPILEVGASSGGVIYPFHQNGFKVSGLDYDENYLSYGSSKGLALHAGDIHSYTPPASPGVIMYCHVLEHIPNVKREFERLHDIMDATSFLYIEVPGVYNLKFRSSYFGDLLLYLQYPHVFNFTLCSLTNLLGKYRFERVHGDEYIRAVFKKSEKVFPVTSNESELVLDHLEKIERLHSNTIMRLLKWLLYVLARNQKVMNCLKKIYRSVFRRE